MVGAVKRRVTAYLAVEVFGAAPVAVAAPAAAAATAIAHGPKVAVLVVQVMGARVGKSVVTAAVAARRRGQQPQWNLTLRLALGKHP